MPILYRQLTIVKLLQGLEGDRCVKSLEKSQKREFTQETVESGLCRQMPDGESYGADGQ